MDAQWETGIARHVRPDGRGTGTHRAARHVDIAAGLPDICRVAAAISRRRPRLRYGERFEPPVDAAELPEDRRTGGREIGIEAARPAARNYRNGVDGQPGHGRGGTASVARVRCEDLSRPLRNGLFVTEPPTQASGGCAQDRPLVREEPWHRRASGHRREYPGAGPDDEHERGGRGYRDRRPGMRARTSRMYTRTGLPLLAPAVGTGGGTGDRRPPAARPERTAAERDGRGPVLLVEALQMAGEYTDPVMRTLDGSA